MEERNLRSIHAIAIAAHHAHAAGSGDFGLRDLVISGRGELVKIKLSFPAYKKIFFLIGPPKPMLAE
jgi:hypothetical protein